MERENKLWEGKGLLWQNLAIYETSKGMVGVLSNPVPSYMKEREIIFPDSIRPFAELVAEIQKMDEVTYYELTVYTNE